MEKEFLIHISRFEMGDENSNQSRSAFTGKEYALNDARQLK